MTGQVVGDDVDVSRWMGCFDRSQELKIHVLNGVESTPGQRPVSREYYWYSVTVIIGGNVVAPLAGARLDLSLEP